MEHNEYKIPKTAATRHTKKRILIYQIGGLGYGGTEKTLQSLANMLCQDYTVFFMYSLKGATNTRESFLDKRITLIPFEYKSKQDTYPYYIRGMTPHIKKIINDNCVDIIITADSGYTQYPLNTISKTPIVMINIFGSPTLQKNITHSVFISNSVREYSEMFTGKLNSNRVAYLPIPKPSKDSIWKAQEIRVKFSIPANAFVFGRIGRNSNSIFDPIGIKAFKKIVADTPDAYYLIMSPPPILEKMVSEEKIPNVYFLKPSGDESDIWGFHLAINCLAHFRSDGETFGLNIAESMSVGNPIITHKSNIWNAHLEYLSPEFSRVANTDDIDSYAQHMREYMNIYKEKKDLWDAMRTKASYVANELFSEKKYAEQIKPLINNIDKI